MVQTWNRAESNWAGTCFLFSIKLVCEFNCSKILSECPNSALHNSKLQKEYYSWTQEKQRYDEKIMNKITSKHIDLAKEYMKANSGNLIKLNKLLMQINQNTEVEHFSFWSIRYILNNKLGYSFLQENWCGKRTIKKAWKRKISYWICCHNRECLSNRSTN